MVRDREADRTLLVVEPIALTPPVRRQMGMPLFEYRSRWQPGMTVGYYDFGFGDDDPSGYTVEPMSTYTAPVPLVDEVEEAVWTDWEDESSFPELEVTVLIADNRPNSAGRVAVLCSSDWSSSDEYQEIYETTTGVLQRNRAVNRLQCHAILLQ